jgi:SAM-dependent methyltransferase
MEEATRSPYDQTFFEEQQDGSRRSAEIILPLAFQWARHPESVVDVGCGVGTWLDVACQLGVTEVLGIDGVWVDRAQLHIPDEHFIVDDLSAPTALDRTFDLALSMEVAEHLPAASAASFVSYLTGLSDYVLFSAAVPGQGGTNHVNEQWPDYWASLFADNGYVQLDPIRPHIWRNLQVEVCYCQNTFLYVAEPIVVSDEALRAEAELTRSERLMILGSRLARRHANPSVTTALKILGRSIQRSLFGRQG